MNVSGVLSILGDVGPAVVAVGLAVLAIHVALKAHKWLLSIIGAGDAEYRFNREELARLADEADDYMFDRQVERPLVDMSRVRYVSNEEYEANHGYSFATFNYMKSL